MSTMLQAKVGFIQYRVYVQEANTHRGNNDIYLVQCKGYDGGKKWETMERYNERHEAIEAYDKLAFPSRI